MSINGLANAVAVTATLTGSPEKLPELAISNITEETGAKIRTLHDLRDLNPTSVFGEGNFRVASNGDIDIANGEAPKTSPNPQKKPILEPGELPLFTELSEFTIGGQLVVLKEGLPEGPQTDRVLEKLAKLPEKNQLEIMSFIIGEGGISGTDRTIPVSISTVQGADVASELLALYNHPDREVIVSESAEHFISIHREAYNRALKEYDRSLENSNDPNDKEYYAESDPVERRADVAIMINDLFAGYEDSGNELFTYTPEFAQYLLALPEGVLPQISHGLLNLASLDIKIATEQNKQAIENQKQEELRKATKMLGEHS